MGNLASGNNTFDNDSNILYVSFVSGTFLYLLMSVMRVSFHINKSYIDDIIGLSMKFLLSLIICSQVHVTCMPAYQWPETFNTSYDCMMFGYEESMNKMKEIGRTEANKHGIYIRFVCTPEETI
jgi:hypothetical protein